MLCSVELPGQSIVVRLMLYQLIVLVVVLLKLLMLLPTLNLWVWDQAPVLHGSEINAINLEILQSKLLGTGRWIIAILLLILLLKITLLSYMSMILVKLVLLVLVSKVHHLIQEIVLPSKVITIGA